MTFRKELPLLNALSVFATAAQAESLTAAARELVIAQSAVSRHIGNLEENFRIKLFDRRGRRLVLTPAGQRLAEAVGTGLGHIRGVVNELRKEVDRAIITIACTYDVAYLWMMPRFGLLRGRFDNHQIRLVTYADFRSFDDSDVDISIRFGRETDWPDTFRLKLFDEEVFPVCSPAFLDANPRLRDGDPRDLLSLPLLHLEQRSTLRGVRWAQWFSAIGLPPPAVQDPMFTNYTGTLYEAIAGRGIALAWGELLGDLLQRGLLVRIGSRSVRGELSRFVVHKSSARSIVHDVATWLADLDVADEPLPLMPPLT